MTKNKWMIGAFNIKMQKIYLLLLISFYHSFTTSIFAVLDKLEFVNLFYHSLCYAILSTRHF